MFQFRRFLSLGNTHMRSFSSFSKRSQLQSRIDLTILCRASNAKQNAEIVVDTKTYTLDDIFFSIRDLRQDFKVSVLDKTPDDASTTIRIEWPLSDRRK